MDSGCNIIAVVPALNEESTIGGVVSSISPHVSAVIVVDDGSTDTTAEAAGSSGAIVLRNHYKSGYDVSVSKGMDRAVQLGADILVTFDADGQHDPQDIPRFVAHLVNQDMDMVVGNRGIKARVSEYLFSFFAHKKMGVSDPICGLKAIRRSVYESVGYFDRIGSIGSQILFEGNRRGFKVSELDIDVAPRQDKPRFGRSFVANCKITWGFLKLVCNETFPTKSASGV